LQKLKEEYEKVRTAVAYALEAEKDQMAAQGQVDVWLNITKADYACLTSQKPERVKAMYRSALTGAGQLNLDATIRQLKLYEHLGVREANVAAALKVLPALQDSEGDANLYHILFTGHMVDKVERSQPRFPAKIEDAVREAIRKAVVEVKEKIPAPLKPFGIAGGACGGDIIFHEVCAELGFESKMYLAAPPDDFKAVSVNFAGATWTDRFNALLATGRYSVLHPNDQLPKWLLKKKNYTIWERNNLWALNRAMVNGSINMALVALWDGEEGDGPGGTGHMVEEARGSGARVTVIDIKSL
ncbi:MAG: hypothetical protein EBZ77_12115, partial [Chitinophagia bacterium]|nr:hypothetical protein [Chitinophagia bacterium]